MKASLIVLLLLLILLSPSNIPPTSAHPQKTSLHQNTIDLSAGVSSQIGSVYVRSLPEESGIRGIDYKLGFQRVSGNTQISQAQNIAESGPSVGSTGAPGIESITSNLVLNGVGGLNPPICTQQPCPTYPHDPNPCVCSPPDPSLGVGPNQVFEVTNQAGIIYSKTGTVLKSTFSLYSFFNLTSAKFITDPEVLYDKSSARWFASILDKTDGRVQFAVSTSNDPTATWRIYFVSTAPGSFPDQPFIGASDDKFVISGTDYTSSNLTFIGAQYWVLNKAELVAGQNSIDYSTNPPNSNYSSIYPARHLSGTSGLFYMVSIADSLQNVTSAAYEFVLQGVPPNTVSTAVNVFSIMTTTMVPDIPQNYEFQGSPVPLVSHLFIDDHVVSASWQYNTFWFAANDGCTPRGDTALRSCLRLIQLTTSGISAPTRVQDFDYNISGLYLFYPAISLFGGQVIVVYGTSSSNSYPSLLVAGRAATDSLNSLEAPVTIKSGTGPDDSRSERYGDYFGAATDPTPTASSAFWVAGEYRLHTSYWNTSIAQIAAISVPSCTASASPTSGVSIVTVHFSASCTGGASPYSYSWQFNDPNNPGASSQAQAPTYSYYCLGICSQTSYPSLTVTDNNTLQTSPSVPSIHVYCRNNCPQAVITISSSSFLSEINSEANPSTTSLVPETEKLRY